MALSTQRLDRYISRYLQVNRKDVRLILAQQRVSVDNCIATQTNQLVNKFSHIEIDGVVAQRNNAHYIMLNKPVGVVCATKDTVHKTVIDVIAKDYEKTILNELHIVGRLDLNTSGMVLLTNNSQWSESLTSPTAKVPKCYQVLLENALTDEYINAFAQGMFFSFENITTQPVKLKILASHLAEVTLTEGKYHQIKRMFGRFRNRVVALHRQSIGQLQLDSALPVGESRRLSANEVLMINKPINLLQAYKK